MLAGAVKVKTALALRLLDLLGVGASSLGHLCTVFREVCGQICNDGMAYDSASVRAFEIRKQANYDGVRVTLMGVLDEARCAVQVDVGYGDAVTPGAESVLFPVILQGMPQPTLRAYPVYTVVAEKYQAIASLGIANTRMKDYFDLWVLAQHATLDRPTLLQAIEATFERRSTPVPSVMPLGLSPAFAANRVKRQQWRAFLSKNRLVAPDLVDALIAIRTLVGF